ncbi:TATA-binding protein-associated factor 172 [Lampetra fluviatilis]
MAVSRLDRLFILLDTGTTPVTRKAAAQQLGEVQRLHPHELHNLLAKVITYLRSPNWDTRIAAGQAVEAIARNVPEWNPLPKSKLEGEQGRQSPDSQDDDRLAFRRFDIARLLKHGASLLGSTGAEFDVQDDKSDVDPKERIARQRKLLQKKLGLDVGSALGMNTHELFDDDDLNASSSSANHTKPQPFNAVEIMESEFAHGMSNRQKNKAKRMAKLHAKQRSRENTDVATTSDTVDGEPDEKKRKVAVEVPIVEDKVLLETLPENSCLFEEMNEWPFESFCEELCNDLFSPSWEVRHGAATGLREVLKAHGPSGGKPADATLEEIEEQHQQWLEDLSIRLLCVFALDRFGDFVSDEVVAPVRETCAQTLGVVLRHMRAEGVLGTTRVLLQLLGQEQWEVRHGGLLGLKYTLAVRQDLIEALLPRTLPVVIEGLQDMDDDVRAVAAAALVPVVESLVQLHPEKIPVIMNTLWDSLLELDDLTASTNSIMTLLSSLLIYPAVRLNSMQQSFTVLVPRVWPFLRHNSSSVRKAALETLNTILSTQDSQSCSLWLTPILQDMMRFIYQVAILESSQDICYLVQKVWQELLAKAPLQYIVAAACPWMGAWLCLMMQPSHMPIDPNMLMETRARAKDKCNVKARPGQPVREVRHEYIAGSETVHEDPASRDYHVMRTRLLNARLLGALSCCISHPSVNLASQEIRPAESLAQLLLFYLNSKSALQRIAVSLVISEWADHKQDCTTVSDAVRPRLQAVLSEQLYYDEIAVPFTRMQTECKQLVSVLLEGGYDVRPRLASAVLTIEQALQLVGPIFNEAVAAVEPSPVASQQLQGKRQQVQSTVHETSVEWQLLHLRVHMFAACAVVAMRSLPDKMNPVIKPLMEAVRREENVLVQGFAAGKVSQLLQQCVGRSPCPNQKIVKNLCNSACIDSVQTPAAACPIPSSNDTSKGSSQEKEKLQHSVNKLQGIITLYRAQKAASSITSRKGPAPRPRGPAPGEILHGSLPEGDQAQKANLVQRRGAELTLARIAKHLGMEMHTVLPYLWEAMLGPLVKQVDSVHFSSEELLAGGDVQAQDLINALQVFEILTPALSPELHPQIVEQLPRLCACLQHPYTVVRHMAARCLSVLSKLVTVTTMNVQLEIVLPWLGAVDNDTKREGAIEALACVMDALDVDIVPYMVLLVVPVMGRMSDQTDSVRLMATQCFATLIRLMPLEAGIPDPPLMSQELASQKVRERHFLEQLLDGSKLDNYAIPVPIHAELRKYQQDGVNWLSFLNKYKLHGILCDDMGLGKTLQSICILAGDHYLRAQEYERTQAADCATLPSMVVCPPTLTGHWVDEVHKFCPREFLNPLHYTGPPSERIRLQRYIKNHNLVVASYDVVRNDIDFFKNIKWNYCILDEGHMIKNGKTKLSKAVKQLTANHRLILSGTPIQNNVLELWSLFDFLMPGFLGTEHQFAARYGKPILASRDARSSSREQEAGVLAMEALHRQVLPFLLRRMKEDVLQDLPPKIIQDYYCSLSPLQVRLYEDFARSQAKHDVDDTISSGKLSSEPSDKTKLKATGHVFQALQYLRKLCNHPALVLTLQHPEFQRICEELATHGSSLRDIQHAPKLSALKQLLLDCGLGGGGGAGGVDSGPEAVVAQHRVLIFCQLKSMLDMVEYDLLRPQLPAVTYLRLDGSVPAGQRHSIVARFNNDPSIDVLLLTTHVGGLGLNLTGADTVVFVEHDWNPMRDLQAMDRAHRIGQKRVVNVYRLITRGTLEEKIMGLQKFKLSIANTVINQDNASLQSMGTEQLLDLFTLEKGGLSEDAPSSGGASKKETIKSVLENLGDLWDQEQYDSEYNLDSFIKSLK